MLVDSAGPATQRKASKAKAIFATNAVKYHVNKLRAQEWAATHGQQVQYAIARDKNLQRRAAGEARPGPRKAGMAATARPRLRRLVRSLAAMRWDASHGHVPLGSAPSHPKGVSRGGGRMDSARGGRRRRAYLE